MTDYEALIGDCGRKLLKALGHLRYSWQKIQKLPKNPLPRCAIPEALVGKIN